MHDVTSERSRLCVMRRVVDVIDREGESMHHEHQWHRAIIQLPLVQAMS